jgi:hypothetical protein
MRWRASVVAATIGLVVLATASPVLAKGADQATISGPGLARPIVVDGLGEPGSGEQLSMLGDGSGLFLAMFGFSDGQALTKEAPAGPLGPKFELAYRIPGGEPPDTVKQDLYPLAAGGPVTYTQEGQPSFGGKTTGGWYRAPAGFGELLVTLGLPNVGEPVAAAPSVQSAEQSPAGGDVAGRDVAGRDVAPKRGATWMAISGAALVACLVMVAAGALLRRRTR